MRATKKTTFAKITRLGTACLVLAALTLGSAAMSSADPAPHKSAQARRQYIRVTNNISLLIEEYDRAREELKRTKANLADLQNALHKTQADARAARDRLGARVAQVYSDSASQLGVLLGSDSLGQLGDRAAFLSGMVGSDADLVTTARVKNEVARRTGQDVARAVRQQEQLVKLIRQRAAQIRATLPYQLSLEKTFGNSTSPGGASPTGASGAAATAVKAALSALGRPYSFGASGPSAFDCSGLMMWAWSQAGVSLPHSSSMQYSVLPHVALSQLRPGDLLFSYSPIHHVGMYIGGGKFVHAPHTGDVVRITAVAGYPVVGAGRPG